jgi:hypothetical protein
MKELEEKFKGMIDTAREERQTASDFNRRTEIQGYIRGLEEALKIVRDSEE